MAFSVAAASAGASTVSLDLDKKWLDRIEPQLLANGVDFDDKHDCIYGDCKKCDTRIEMRHFLWSDFLLTMSTTSIRF